MLFPSNPNRRSTFMDNPTLGPDVFCPELQALRNRRRRILAAWTLVAVAFGLTVWSLLAFALGILIASI
jgi:hypothetical protein